MSYISEHPTNFNWKRAVRLRVRSTQRKFPWKTFINTYRWHPPYNPPYVTRQYDAVSFDVWGGGGHSANSYNGYRGKPLPPDIGQKIFNHLFYTNYGPPISWIIYRGKMWTRAGGWGPSPPGPRDSDPGHYNHIHVTYAA